MPELHVRLLENREPLEPLLRRFAAEWQCDMLENGLLLQALTAVDEPLGPAGWVLLPEIMMRKHGLFVFPGEGEIRVCREEDATTWEDFLLMRLAHGLAAHYRATLYLDGYDEPLEVAPDKFETFDHYVATVLEFEDEVVRDMKKHWLYTHRKRAVR